MSGCSAKRVLGNGAIFLGRQHIRKISRQFPIIMPNAAVISEEVLASQAGLQVLRQGGNATDAVVAMAACMQVLQPYTAGVGGDCFIIYYDAATKKVGCVDGSGRSPAALTLEKAVSHKQEDSSRKKWLSGFYATVPGAVKAWFHSVSNHGSGKLCMLDLFSPAICLAKNGYPMDHMKHMAWEYRYQKVLRMPGIQHFLNGDKIPTLGETCSNRPLAALLEGLAKHGPPVFYEGVVAKNLVKAVEKAGGILSLRDLADHLASTELLEADPVSTTYKERVCVYTPPLPTQGAILLETLNVLDAIQLAGAGRPPGEFEHLVIEALRQAISDGLQYVADPASGTSISAMLSKSRAKSIASWINKDKRVGFLLREPASAAKPSGTTFMAAADVDGNVCALLGSNARFLGCTVVEEHGFSVHARGAAFSLTPGHVNAFGPRKKPYHSLMPVLVTDAQSHDWLCTLGVMGGISQPGFIIQLLLNMIHFGMDPQQSVSKARFRLGDFFSASADAPIGVEAAFDREALDALKMLGHVVDKIFPDGDCINAGHALMLCRGRHLSLLQEDEKGDSKSQTSHWCGIDPRCNGVALGY